MGRNRTKRGRERRVNYVEGGGGEGERRVGRGREKIRDLEEGKVL